jgi:hypothetical protein
MLFLFGCVGIQAPLGCEHSKDTMAPALTAAAPALGPLLWMRDPKLSARNGLAFPMQGSFGPSHIKSSAPAVFCLVNRLQI